MSIANDWRSWVCFMFTDNAVETQALPDDELRVLVCRNIDADRVGRFAIDVLLDWHRGDSPRGTEQCPDCGRFPYEGHRTECRLIYAINYWRGRMARNEGLPHAIAPCSAPDNTVQSGEIGRNTDVTKQAQNHAEKEEL